ncbi:Peptidase family M48 [Pseudoruegeria aquimaris]|uniref:Peptidase family M48 n=1 Tax=Pseudoruegeria aquimaris TaxID=393663 RepID=A0A1Y5SM27_9RHOB|nr:M48 family metalloprotease [Pseudoruegeria aquimaris]SLN43329.1 Peptidase family M48 [Pseudoruegeria aquimaris]
MQASHVTRALTAPARAFALLGLALLVAACAAPPPTPRPAPAPAAGSAAGLPSPEQAARNFAAVVARVEPVAEAECLARTRGTNCNFQVVVDDRPGQPPNAYQTIDRSGRPILAFTVPLIADVRNQDELAFIMGHEAAHHISQHLTRQQDNALAGALVAGILASQLGGDASAIEAAQEFGATVGARSYSKDFELEADALGTVIAHRAGYDPVRGAEYFTRIPDPGNRFLGTHPPNAARMQTVRATAARLK